MTMIRLISLFFACLLGFFAVAAHPAEFEPLDGLEDAVNEFLLDHYTALSPNSEVNISVNNPDSRLRLKKCDKPLTVRSHGKGSRNGRATVRVSCEGSHQWGLFVTAKVTVITDIVVAAHSLPRGHVLEDSDLALAPRNISLAGAGYIQDPSRLQGKVLKRALAPGATIRLTQVTEPMVIARGDAVTIEARSGTFAVLSSGIALSKGRIGQQIQVRNSKSERIVKARVTGPGKVRVGST